MTNETMRQIANDITDTIKLHSPNTLTLTGKQLRELTGYTVAQLAQVTREMKSAGLIRVSGEKNPKDFTLAPEGKRFCSDCENPVVPKHEIVTHHSPLGIGVVCIKCTDDPISPTERQLNLRVREALEFLIETCKEDTIAPEDVVRTLSGVVDKYARSLSIENKHRRVIWEDARTLVKCADKLRY